MDLLPYIVKSSEWYNYWLETSPGAHTIHQCLYAQNKDITGAVDIDIFWMKWADIPPLGNACFEWWKYQASTQKIWHMFDIGDTKVRQGRYHITAPTGAIGGEWLNRYMNIGDKILHWYPYTPSCGTIQFYNNTSSLFVDGQFNGPAERYSQDPSVAITGQFCYEVAIANAGRQDFGGDLGTRDWVLINYAYPNEKYGPGGKGVETFTFAKGAGMVGWILHIIDPHGVWHLEDNQPLFIYKSICPPGHIAPAFSVVCPNQYLIPEYGSI